MVGDLVVVFTGGDTFLYKRRFLVGASSFSDSTSCSASGSTISSDSLPVESSVSSSCLVGELGFPPFSGVGEGEGIEGTTGLSTGGVAEAGGVGLLGELLVVTLEVAARAATADESLFFSPFG